MPGYMVPIEDNRPAIIKPIDLGQDGIEFLKSKMIEQQCPLSTSIARLFSVAGKAFAPLEEGTDINEAKKFDIAGDRPTVAIQKWLADYIEFNWGKGCQLVIEDPWMKPEDVRKYPPKLKYFFSDSGVYYLPETNDIYNAIEQGKHASNFLFFGFVISPRANLPTLGVEVDKQYITTLALNTQVAFSIAYDWEGYVIWER